ncbi:MAG TPA: hypothetical protein VGK32_01635 [Vicinamibacterales bacterium]
MKRYVLWAIVVLCAAPVTADDTLVRFDRGIGVDPVAKIDGNGAPVLNSILGVPPGGFPWVIEGLNATVRTDGRVTVDGRGLLLAGGDGIGTNGNQNVSAWLFCGTSVSKTGVVPLDDNGDFHINDMLTPTPPDPCGKPVLLIVNARGAWFAAGIPKR